MHTQFETLGLKPEEITTYFSLLEAGPLSASVLAKKMGIPRPSIYGFLKRLTEKGLVVESQKSGIKTFLAESPEKLNFLFEQQKERLLTEQAEYQKILPLLQTQSALKYINPKLQLFEGVEGLQNVLKDMLLYRDMETKSFWPIKKMIDILSPEFFRYLNKDRIRRNLYIRAIWPENEVVEISNHPYLGVGEGFKREIRIAPSGIDFSMGYWIYGNKVAFISSRKESFGFILESQEFAQMLSSQFEVLWGLSNPLKDDSREAREFLQGI